MTDTTYPHHLLDEDGYLPPARRRALLAKCGRTAEETIVLDCPPPGIAFIVAAVRADDAGYFAAHPERRERRRAYVPGEQWPAPTIPGCREVIVRESLSGDALFRAVCPVVRGHERRELSWDGAGPLPASLDSGAGEGHAPVLDGGCYI